MRYGHLEGIEKPVSRLVLGADNFTLAEKESAFELLDAYVAGGGNTLDMAHVYRGGECQRVVGEWISARGNRASLVLLDKGCHPYGHPRMTPEDLDSDLAENLERLGLQSVDIFCLHRDDPSTPVEPIMRRLNEHIASRRIAVIGASNWKHERIEEANRFAASEGLQPFRLVSNNFSLAIPNEPMWSGCVSVGGAASAQAQPVSDHMDDALDWHRRTRFPLFSWSSQGGGFFADRQSDDITRVYHNRLNYERKERAAALARELGVPVLSVVLAYVLSQPFPVWALIGPRKPEELEPSSIALEIELSAGQIAWLESG
ncbi:MAG TPA: aldo/keto reductase [Fimbriimonadaceae bacterium]|nr:aldo/keto reductase [Fimbriimonadaceae bacterium]